MRRTVLLIDNSENAPSLRACLADQGYEVLWAPQAEVGVYLAHLRPPDLILLDPELPVLGERGGAIRYLQESRRTRRIPICAINLRPHAADECEGERARVAILNAAADLPQDLFASVESCFRPSR